MALKAAEGKRNILSITDFFIQTLVYYKHCGGGGEINNTSRKTLYRSIDRGGGGGAPPPPQTDRFYFLNYRKFNSSTDSKLDYYLATKKSRSFMF
jgi:hypothetical protein